MGLSQWPHLPLPHLIGLNLSMNALESTWHPAGPNHAVIRLDRLRSLDLSRNRLTQVKKKNKNENGRIGTGWLLRPGRRIMERP